MKLSRLIPFAALLPLTLGALMSCNQPPTSAEISSSSAPVMSGSKDTGAASSSMSSADENAAFDGIVRLHYHSLTDADQGNNRAIYIWAPKLNGSQFSWTGHDDFGAYFDLDCDTEPWKGHIHKEISCIIKGPVVGDWGTKTTDTLVPLLPMIKKAEIVDGRRVAHVYLADGNGNELDVFRTAEEALQDSFRLVNPSRDRRSLNVTATATPASKISVYRFDASYYALPDAVKKQEFENYFYFEAPKPTSPSFSIALPGEDIVDPQCDYLVLGNFDASKPDLIKQRYATMESLFDTPSFIKDYTYAGHDLGVRYYQDHTEFRIWAPTTVLAQVIVYKSPNSSLYPDASYPGSDDKAKIYTLFRQKGGVYAGAIPGDLEGKGYTFRLYYEGTSVETVDPQAFAVGADGDRGAIIDFSKTNPEGWDNVKRPTDKFESMVTYEVHVRDFTAHSSWASKKNNARGTFLAMAEEGTEYEGKATGFSHLKELGVNAVQLLPVFDRDNIEHDAVDEVTGKVTPPAYNWGYDPKNYNAVEGVYSSDPFNPYARVKEYKELVKKLADNNMGVVMDVVYNHVKSIATSSLTKTCPKYYFLYQNGSAYDTSGCGNATHTSRIMMERFMIDSVAYWAKEFKLKGFRFDLMGCISSNAMRHLKDALYEIDPAIVVYGEGWHAQGDPSSVGIQYPAEYDTVYTRLGDNGKGSVGCFSGSVRDGFKGECVSEKPRTTDVFINATQPCNDAVWNSATAFLGQYRAYDERGISTPASQSVNYLACHDNYTLYDHVYYMFHQSDWAGIHSECKDAVLALNSTIAMCNGMAFLHGGDEFFRQKIMYRADDPDLYEEMLQAKNDGFPISDGVAVMRNSYKYGDYVNAFRWDLKAENQDYINRYIRAIQTRKTYLSAINGLTKANVKWPSNQGAGNPAIGCAMDNGNLIVALGGNTDSACLTFDLAGEYDVVYSSKGRTGKMSASSVTPQKFELIVLAK